MFHLCVYYRTIPKDGNCVTIIDGTRLARTVACVHESRWKETEIRERNGNSHTQICMCVHTLYNHTIAQFVISGLCVLRIYLWMENFFILSANKCSLSDSINAKLFAILQRCDYDHFNQMEYNYDSTMELVCVCVFFPG